MAWATAQFVGPMAKKIEEASQGRMKVEVYAWDELVPNTEMIPALRAGTIDLTYGVDSLMASPADVAVLGGAFPFAAEEALEVDVLWKELGLGEIWQEAYDEQVPGVTFLNMSSVDPCNIISTTPIHSWEDLQGLRVHAHPTQVPFLEKAGMTVLTVPLGEVGLSIQTGILDGVCDCGAFEGYASGYRDVADYFLSQPLGRFALGWFVSTNSWEALPPDLQALWLMAIDTFYYDLIVYYHWGEGHHRVLEGEEFIVTTMPAEEWARWGPIKEEVYAEIAASSDRCRRVLEIIEDYQAELEKIGYPYR